MAIRDAAKAIILHDDKILLNKCLDTDDIEYYTLPGGGQHQYETLAEALVRECLEETGHIVVPTRFAALYEEICDNMSFRDKNPDYAHKLFHIFICRLASDIATTPTELDDKQMGCEWLNVSALNGQRVLPKVIGDRLIELVSNEVPVFLGSHHLDF